MLKLPAFRYALIAPSLFLLILPVTHTTGLRHLCLLLSLLTVLWAWKRLPAMVWPHPFVRVAIVFWLLICVLATLISSDFDYSQGELRNEVIYPLLTALVFTRLTSQFEDWQRWRKLLLLSLFIVAVACPISLYYYGDFVRDSLVGDRNAYSTYIVLSFPLLLLSLTYPPAELGHGKLWIHAAIVLALVTGALSLNRNMWIGLIAEFLVFAGLIAWHQKRSLSGAVASIPQTRAFKLRVIGVVIASAVVLVGLFTLVSREKEALVLQNGEPVVAGPINDPRIAIWRYAIDYIKERPLTGYGYGRGILRKAFRTHFDNPLKWHGHNVVLNYGMEAGIPGMLAIVLLFAALYFQCWRIYRSAHPDNWRWGLWGLTILVGISIKMMTDDILVRDNSLLFWAMMGMIAGLSLRKNAQDAHSRQPAVVHG